MEGKTMKKLMLGVLGVIFFVGLFSNYSVAIGADKTADVLVWLKFDGGLMPMPFEATVILSNKNFSSIYNKTIKVKNAHTVEFKDVPYGTYILSVKDGESKGQKLEDGSFKVEISKLLVSLTINWGPPYGKILELSQSSSGNTAKKSSAVKEKKKYAEEAVPASNKQ
jgi:hypothetical protein